MTTSNVTRASGARAARWWILSSALAALGLVLGCASDLLPSVNKEATAGSASSDSDSDSSSEPAAEVPLAAAKLLIEHNATDEDTGFQGFVDGEPWNKMSIESPDGDKIVSFKVKGELEDFGLTELFFETNEPPNAESPIDDVLARLPEGVYQFEGRSAEGDRLVGEAIFTHAIPAGPEIVSPEDGDTVDPSDVAIEWEPVTETINGDPVDIVAYQVIVELDVEVDLQGFAKKVFSVHVGPDVTRVTVPPEFLEAGQPYGFEVLALEASGNQTLSGSEFETE